MSIIISQLGSKAQKIDKSEFEKEGYLQNYIHQNPESIPVYEIDEDKKLLVVAREFSTESGPIDALALDKDGDIYVVETKLYKNPDKRTVVAQALDYGASLWRHSDYHEFLAKINNEITKKFNLSFEEKARDFFNIDETQIEILLESVKSNLMQGNIKFVILMDSIEDRLKDLIVYINQNSNFDIYAVQMEYYKFDKYEIMIPKLFGMEVKKNIASAITRNTKIWTFDEFLLDAKKKVNNEEFLAIEKLLNFSNKYADNLALGKGMGKATANPIFKNVSNRRFYWLDSSGQLCFSIDWALSDTPNNEANKKLKNVSEKLSAIGLIVAESQFKGKNKIEDWYDKVDKILAIFKEVIL